MAFSRIASDYLANGVLCMIPFEDHTVYVDPRDDRIAQTLLAGKPWQRHHLTRALDQLSAAGRLSPGGTMIDVGANIGLTVLYGLLSGKFASAIAIEPEPQNLALLRRNIATNGFSACTSVIAKAASNTAGTLELHRDRRNLGAHSLESDFVLSDTGIPLNVSVDRLDALVEQGKHEPAKISFIKIDVEGHEFAVLEGMPDILKRRIPVMLEMTFDGGKRLADRDKFVACMSAYEHVLDLGPAQASPVALRDFEPSQDQHELLIY